MTSRSTLRPVLSLVAFWGALMWVSGCKRNAETLQAKASNAAGNTAAAELPVAPAWRLKNLEGADVTLSQFKGKVVIVDFWATWCPPCRAEMPVYVDLYKKFADRGLVIVGISLDGQGPGVVKKFVDSMGITYPIVMGDEDVTSAYQVQVMPTTFVVSREGRILHSKIGAVTQPAEFEKLIESYL